MSRKRGEKAGIDWDRLPLGRVTDTELARELGVHRTAVRHARTRRGIKAASRTKRSERRWRTAAGMVNEMSRLSARDRTSYRVSIRLTPAQHKQWLLLSRERDQTFTDMVRQWISNTKAST